MVSFAKLFDEGKLDAYHEELKRRLGITPEESAATLASMRAWKAANRPGGYRIIPSAA